MLKTKIETLQKQIITSKAKSEACKEERAAVALEIETVKQASEILDVNLRELTSTLNSLHEVYVVSKKSVKSVREYEKEIVEKLASHIQLENEMASDLLKYRGIVAEARSTYQKFYVKRIWLVMTTNVILILQKAADGKHALQIDDGKKVVTYKIAEVDAVFRHPTKSNRFFLRAYGEDDQEYESENTGKIMGLIRELIFSDFNDRE